MTATYASARLGYRWNGMKGGETAVLSDADSPVIEPFTGIKTIHGAVQNALSLVIERIAPGGLSRLSCRVND